MVTERLDLSPVPNWTTGIVVEVGDDGRQLLRCRHCREVVCTIDLGDQLWVLVDVARDHRMFCRDPEEWSNGTADAAALAAKVTKLEDLVRRQAMLITKLVREHHTVVEAAAKDAQ